MRIPAGAHQLVVRTLSARATRGFLELGPFIVPCALGRSGSRTMKREGDGASPRGRWPLCNVYVRRDRVLRPRTGLELRTTRPSDGWCDSSCDHNYNRLVSHPYPTSAEHLWRSDGLYDLIVVLGYNDRPRLRTRGSAIFLHCARPDYGPTEGCIAVARPDLLKLLPFLSRRTRLVIP
jgi:L,D-peptidoglycan transpeptidase YkuD (ErfK/YbiS/YcfS/YnhG family)